MPLKPPHDDNGLDIEGKPLRWVVQCIHSRSNFAILDNYLTELVFCGVSGFIFGLIIF